MNSLQPDTAWEQAFEALMPVASPTAQALDRVQATLDEDRRLTEPLRRPLNPSMRAGVVGSLRFGYTAVYWDGELQSIPVVTKVSTPVQELQYIYLWLLADSYILRVKHEPQQTVDPGSRRLWHQEDLNDVSEVFLCWDTRPDFTISNPRFATFGEPKWSIPLALLLARADAPTPINPPSQGPRVRSTRLNERREGERG